MLTAVSAKPSSVFDVDASGNAQLSVTDTLSLGVDNINLGMSANAGNGITFSGDITDIETLSSPDYSLQLTSQGSTTTASFDFTGNIRDIIDAIGPFDITVTLANQGSTLVVEISGSISNKLLEEQFLLNATLIESDPEGFKADLELLFNEIFSGLPLTNKPTVSIDSFDLSGQNTLTLDMKLSIMNWNEFIASLVGSGYQSGSFASDSITCMGLSPDNMVSAMLGAGMSTTITLTGSPSSISGQIEANSTYSSTAEGMSLDSLALRISKLASSTTLSGSGNMNDMQTFMDCVMRNYLPSECSVEDLRYSLLKNGGGTVTQTLEASIGGIAQKRSGNLFISFPSSVTLDTDITLNVPSGMSILSVLGGQKVDDHSATSTPGEEFIVTYGQAGGGDMTMWIVAAIVIVALIFLLTRKKK